MWLLKTAENVHVLNINVLAVDSYQEVLPTISMEKIHYPYGQFALCVIFRDSLRMVRVNRVKNIPQSRESTWFLK